MSSSFTYLLFRLHNAYIFKLYAPHISPSVTHLPYDKAESYYIVKLLQGVSHIILFYVIYILTYWTHGTKIYVCTMSWQTLNSQSFARVLKLHKKLLSSLLHQVVRKPSGTGSVWIIQLLNVRWSNTHPCKQVEIFNCQKWKTWVSVMYKN